MPFKHTVTDSRGQVHTRTSAERQYAFAVVRNWDSYTLDSGTVIPAGAAATWTSRRDLADKEAVQARKRWNTIGIEIIPCTPVATGKHAKIA